MIRQGESGFSLVEVMVSLAIFAIFSVAALYIFTRNAAVVVENSQLANLYRACDSIGSLLDASADAVDWNGATFTASTVSGVPSGDSSLDSASLAGIQGDLGSAGSGASIGLAVVPDNGTTCPCTATATLQWGSNNSQTVTWQTRY